MIRIACITRTGEEELALMANCTDRNGIFLEVLDGDDQPRQEDIFEYDAVIITGKPQGTQRLASSDLVMKRVGEAVRNKVPVLGISGGARLLAEICRNSVDAGVPGAGSWSPFRLTEEGRKDTLFFGLDDSCFLFREYGDALVIPPGAVVLAVDGSGLPVAFRYGNAYALDCIVPWKEHLHPNDHIHDTDALDFPEGRFCEDFSGLVRSILGNFLWLIELYRSSKRRTVTATEPRWLCREDREPCAE
ncbi:MAG: hypothetical protein AVO39_05055 [delta proteobacterium MLS_D]|jgi:GMP synthase-like glutamine amidotransferase|nr:MAG: hypothetical protein AVO39_05055 [delta proteobacterium MLS_D]